MSKKTLSKEEIIHLAHLANLHLTDEEIEKFRTQMSAILDYVSQLNKVDTQNIEAVSQVTGLKDVVRHDEISSTRSLSQEEVLKNAPNKKDGYIKVKAIFTE